MTQTMTRPTDDEHQNEQSGPSKPRVRTLADWITLGLSVAIIGGIVGLTTFLHVAGPHDPPHIVVSIQLEGIVSRGGQHYVPIEIKNAGNQTAQDVEVSLVLINGDVRRQAPVMVPFLAGGGSQDSVVAFPIDPRTGTLEVDSITYQKP